VVGLLFGSWNVLYSWLFPLADDTAIALLAFYGPMFLVWAFDVPGGPSAVRILIDQHVPRPRK
jgi:hypothetical protein